MNKKNIIGIIFATLGIILAMIPKTIAPVCGMHMEGKAMKCHFMGNAVIGLAIGIIVLSIIFLFIKENNKAIGIVYANIVLGILVILMPLKIIGTCGSPMMACNTHTKPAIIVVAGIYLLVNVYYLLKGNN